MCFVLAALIGGVSTPAKAESDFDKGLPAEISSGNTIPGQENKDRWVLGAGVAMVPKFQGSDDYEARPVPLIDVKYGRFFAKTSDGIGVNIVETSTFTAGAGVDWMEGYDDDDVPAGIRGVDGALGARIFVSARFDGLVATLAATQAMTESDRGLLIDAGLAYPIHATGRLTITPSIGTTWANEKYMNGYFGIDAAEAAASGLARYEPTNGFKDVSFRIGARYRITDSVSAVGAVGVTHLLGEAADSPFVEEKTQPTALMGLTYSF